MYDFKYIAGGSISTGDYFAGIEAFYETPLNFDFAGDPQEYDEHKIGLKIGLEKYDKNTYKVANYTANENTISLPVTAYYKYDAGIKRFAFIAGAGLSVLRSDIKITNNGSDYKWKSALHVTVGTEYRLSEHFALGFDLQYITSSAKIKGKYKINGNNYKLTFSDRSVLNGALAARYYF